MKRLSVIDSNAATIDTSERLPFAGDCDRCKLAKGRCLRGYESTEPGGVLAVFSSPTNRTYGTGRPFSSTMEVDTVRAVRKIVGDSAGFEYATRAPGGDDDTVEACRPYLAAAMDAAKPARVFAFGREASVSLVGDTAPVYRVRRTWRRLASGVVVFFFPEPYKVFNNSILWRDLLEDLQWANAVPLEELDDHTGKTYALVQTEEQAAKVRDEIAGGVHVYDVETFGRLCSKDFRIVSLASMRPGAGTCYVWPEESLAEGDPRRAYIVEILRRSKHVAHNAKYEIRSVFSHFGFYPEHLEADTMIHAKQVKANGAGGLASLAWSVGFGGHKDEAKEDLATKTKALRTLRRESVKPIVVEYEYETRTNEKTGKTQRRKVPTVTREPTDEERRGIITHGWRKLRASKTSPTGKTNLALEVTGDSEAKITEPWMVAALSGQHEATYTYGLMNREICYRYNARDVVATEALYRKLSREIQATPAFSRLWRSHLHAVPWALAKLEDAGMYVDREALGGSANFFEERETKLLEEIREHAPGLDPSSSAQISALLFGPKSKGGLGLKPVKVTAKGKKPSTDKESLEALRDAHPVVASLLEHRTISKLRGTYARGLADAREADGRIRASLNPTGTETGRLSCSDPNLQTIPSRGEHAKKIKNIFTAPPGYTLLQVDYSTLEMRVAAILSQDPTMIAAFRSGEDPHTRTASLVSPMVWGSEFETCGFGYTEDEAPDEDARAKLRAEKKRRRGVCKWVNFGTIYGQSTAALASLAKVSESEAETAQRIVLGRFDSLRSWIEKTAKDSAKSGETWSIWDGQPARRRPIPDIGERSDAAKVGHGERTSYNTPVQGSGSEYCLASLVALTRWIEEDGVDARVIMTVHDSIIFEVREDDVHEVAHHARRIMEGWNSGLVPLVVDMEIGKSWGDLEPYEPL